MRALSGGACARIASGSTFELGAMGRAIQILIVAASGLAAFGACSQPGPPVGDGTRDAGTSKPTTLTSDAGIYATAPTPHQVSCTSSTPVCSSPANVCCGVAKFQQGTPSCLADGGLCGVALNFVGYESSCVSDPTICQGELNHTCDGPEDCPAAEACCVRQVQNQFKTACAPTCPALGSEAPGVLAQLCHDHRDCPPAYPACCASQATATAQPAFGSCLALSALKPNLPAACDVP